MRRMTDAICREHQVRPRTVAEINAIEPLLRSLAPLNAGALMPKIASAGKRELIAIRLKGKNLAVEIGSLRLIDSGDQQHGRETSPNSPGRQCRRLIKQRAWLEAALVFRQATNDRADDRARADVGDFALIPGR